MIAYSVRTDASAMSVSSCGSSSACCEGSACWGTSTTCWVARSVNNAGVARNTVELRCVDRSHGLSTVMALVAAARARTCHKANACAART